MVFTELNTTGSSPPEVWLVDNFDDMLIEVVAIFLTCFNKLIELFNLNIQKRKKKKEGKLKKMGMVKRLYYMKIFMGRSNIIRWGTKTKWLQRNFTFFRPICVCGVALIFKFFFLFGLVCCKVPTPRVHLN